MYKVPFVNYPLHYQSIRDDVLNAVRECMVNGDLILRKQTTQFEENMATYLGVKYVVGLNSGTDALIFALMAAGVKKNDEVITPAHTFIASIAAIKHLQAHPILIDIADDMNMDTDRIEEAVTSKTKAILPVHLNGRCCNMSKIMAIADKHGLTVVEDAAQALGAKYFGVKAGTFASAGCFSLYPAKILGCMGDGGFLATNSQEIAEHAKLLRDHGLDRKTGNINFYGFTSRLDNIQAAILNTKTHLLPQWIQKRRQIAQLYHENLKDSSLQLPPPPKSNSGYFDVYQNYVVKSQRRDNLQNYLEEKGVETMVHWRIPNHKQKALGFNADLPKTEETSATVLSLPMYPELTNEEVAYVCDCINEWSKQA